MQCQHRNPRMREACHLPRSECNSYITPGGAYGAATSVNAPPNKTRSSSPTSLAGRCVAAAGVRVASASCSLLSLSITPRARHLGCFFPPTAAVRGRRCTHARARGLCVMSPVIFGSSSILAPRRDPGCFLPPTAAARGQRSTRTCLAVAWPLLHVPSPPLFRAILELVVGREYAAPP